MSDESHEGSSPLSYGEGPVVRSEKRCPKCGETKPIDAFYRDKRAKSGRQCHCKACQAAYQSTNAEVLREYIRAYQSANAEVLREYRRAYYAANTDRIREYAAANAEARRAYRTANAEVRCKYNAAYRAANTEARRAYNAAYRASHPDICLAAKHRRRARISGNGGVGFSAQELRHMRLTQGGECAYCMGLYHPRALTVDHIIPTAQGGRHEASNICLACEKCNKSKSNRTPDQWVNRWYWDWRLREPEYIPPHWY